ncbi:MAG: DNA replication/repair protein RecF, partial [Acidimicrobiales bacterium]
EAVAYLSRLESFRSVASECLIRVGAERAVVRAEGVRDNRRMLIETEIRDSGRGRAQVNRQPLRRTRDLLGFLRTTVFSPGDLDLVKGAPSTRRRFLDEVLAALGPRHDSLRLELDRILRQRGVLLKQARGRLTLDVAASLDVWDVKLAQTGEAVAAERERITNALNPYISEYYASLAGRAGDLGPGHGDRFGSSSPLVYRRSWSGELAHALAVGRGDDLRRGTNTMGPHRDDLALVLSGLAAKSYGSQGEQRSLALAMRLAAHALVTKEVGSPPILLLDDVFSELDDQRSSALVAHLPPGQCLLTTAGAVPPGITPALTLAVEAGVLVPQ